MPDPTQIRIRICTTCLFYVTYGEGDPEWTEAEEAAFATKVDSRWTGWTIIADGSDTEFSWTGCDGCGSTLGGDRVDAVAVPHG